MMAPARRAEAPEPAANWGRAQNQGAAATRNAAWDRSDRRRPYKADAPAVVADSGWVPP